MRDTVLFTEELVDDTRFDLRQIFAIEFGTVTRRKAATLDGPLRHLSEAGPVLWGALIVTRKLLRDLECIVMMVDRDGALFSRC